MARVVDEPLLAGAALVASARPASAPTPPSPAARAVAPRVGTTAPSALLGRAAGLGAAAVRALLAVRTG
ncbi:hypothetical protein AMK24_12565 [Streptomyces sp. CB02366]|nr:hypothetical protein AMK24_12565 [Streptomyces sp. CB02366]